MAKPLQLTIESPCHEKWKNMTPSDQGRYCQACEKQVVDFTGMSDAQLLAFFRKPTTGSVCGRFMNDQLDRDMFAPRKRIPWIKYFFQIALPALLFSNRAVAQGEVKTKLKTRTATVPNQCNDIFKGLKPIDNIDSIIKASPPVNIERMFMSAAVLGGVVSSTVVKINLVGKVIDEKGYPITGATVFIKGTNLGTTTDKDGLFELPEKANGKETILQISSIGFSQAEYIVSKKKKVELREIMLYTLEDMMMGDVVVVSTKPKRHAKTKPAIKEAIMESTESKFKVYPNPVIAGSEVHLALNKVDDGYYRLNLIDVEGRSIFEREIWIDKDAAVLTIDIPPLDKGTYFMTLLNKKDKKKYSEKILIQ